MLSGRNTRKIQAQTQFNIVDCKFEASERYHHESIRVFQEHKAHYAILWRRRKKPHCKSRHFYSYFIFLLYMPIKVSWWFTCLSCFQKLMDVLEFLKVPQRNLKSRQVKIHKGSLSSQVENWNDVSKALTGTQYESFIHEDYRR
jgi:hypothetical protein